MNPKSDYIIVYQNLVHKEEGYDNGWHPVTYANGSLVIYGSKELAMQDAKDGEQVVSLNINTP